jgi:UDP-glucuronate 4-epimerase
MKKILVTGAAGFIGFHFCQRLLEEGYIVYGVDNLNNYYDVQLKKDRLAQLRRFYNFHFYKTDLTHEKSLRRIFKKIRPEAVVHMAAQAGVRHASKDPQSYVQSNIAGLVNILENCKERRIKHFVFASSSSVYGLNKRVPFSVEQRTDRPANVYAATKKAGELLAQTYSYLYKLPATGLRFFTVYGPWGRPDMAYYSFAESILSGKPITLFNRGDMKRDFTYIDDVVEGVYRVLLKPPQAVAGQIPFKLYNIGHHSPVRLGEFISVLEKSLGHRAKKKYAPAHPGEVPVTSADISDLKRDFRFKPRTPIEVGLPRFTEWLISYKRQRAI